MSTERKKLTFVQFQQQPETSLPSRMRAELNELAHDAEALDRSIGDHIAGAVVLDRRNGVNLGLLKLTIRFSSMSYRAREAVLAGADTSSMEGVEWVHVNASTTLRHLINQYGDRLLGFDSKRDEVTVEIFSFDVVDNVNKTVRVLVRKPSEAKPA